MRLPRNWKVIWDFLSNRQPAPDPPRSSSALLFPLVKSPMRSQCAVVVGAPSWCEPDLNGDTTHHTAPLCDWYHVDKGAPAGNGKTLKSSASWMGRGGGSQGWGVDFNVPPFAPLLWPPLAFRKLHQSSDVSHLAREQKFEQGSVL